MSFHDRMSLRGRKGGGDVLPGNGDNVRGMGVLDGKSYDRRFGGGFCNGYIHTYGFNQSKRNAPCWCMCMC